MYMGKDQVLMCNELGEPKIRQKISKESIIMSIIFCKIPPSYLSIKAPVCQ